MMETYFPTICRFFRKCSRIVPASRNTSKSANPVRKCVGSLPRSIVYAMLKSSSSSGLRQSVEKQTINAIACPRINTSDATWLILSENHQNRSMLTAHRPNIKITIHVVISSLRYRITTITAEPNMLAVHSDSATRSIVQRPFSFFGERKTAAAQPAAIRTHMRIIKRISVTPRTFLIPIVTAEHSQKKISIAPIEQI